MLQKFGIKFENESNAHSKKNMLKVTLGFASRFLCAACAPCSKLCSQQCLQDLLKLALHKHAAELQPLHYFPCVKYDIKVWLRKQGSREAKLC